MFNLKVLKTMELFKMFERVNPEGKPSMLNIEHMVNISPF